MKTSQESSWRRNRAVYSIPEAAIAPRAVYIHVPFCLHRCGYCDFTLVANRDNLVSQYLQAISIELSQLTGTFSVDSIFVGGGTPTHLTPDQLGQLLEMIAGKFQLSPDGEYSCEANPDGLDDDRLTVLRGGGVNRISLGVQSFDADVLKTLERTHNPQESRNVVQRTHSHIPNISLDLIFAVPGQSQTSWEETLETAIDLPVQHVSTYGLTFEKGTAFYQRRSKGNFHLASNETERQQYAAAMAILGAAGFQQYEISNHAQPNARCRHNEVYWDASEYFAFGPGAARYINGMRSTNSRNVSRWITSWLQGEPLLQDCEQLSATDRAREAVMLGLRRNRGIPQHSFEQRFGCSVRSLAPDALAQHLDEGLLVEVIEDQHGSEPEHWLRLTAEGRFLADNVVIDFL